MLSVCHKNDGPRSIVFLIEIRVASATGHMIGRGSKRKQASVVLATTMYRTTLYTMHYALVLGITAIRAACRTLL